MNHTSLVFQSSSEVAWNANSEHERFKRSWYSGNQTAVGFGDGRGFKYYAVAITAIARSGGSSTLWALRKPTQAPVLPKPDAIAQRKLKEVWALIGTPALFIEATADILRVYLEERFNIHAPERTTEEFLSELKQMPQMTGDQKNYSLNSLDIVTSPNSPDWILPRKNVVNSIL